MFAVIAVWIRSTTSRVCTEILLTGLIRWNSKLKFPS